MDRYFRNFTVFVASTYMYLLNLLRVIFRNLFIIYQLEQSLMKANQQEK